MNIDAVEGIALKRMEEEAAREKKEKKEISTDEKEVVQEGRLREQAALILSMDSIINKIKIEPDISRQLKQTDWWSQSVQDGLSINKRYFKNFTCIRYKNEEDTPPGATAITKNFSKTEGMRTFFRSMPPQVMSMLIPTVKIYKTVFPPETQKDSNVKGYDWKIPFDDVPVKYDGYTSKFVSRDADSILKGNGTLRTVGIKSFSYDYIGNNPEQVDSNIKAKLDIFLQSPTDFNKAIDMDIPDRRFAKSRLKFSYADLINQTTKYKSFKNNLQNEEYYRIKVECAYADIRPEILNDVLDSAGCDKKQKELISNAIKTSRVVLFLSPINYDINFNEDGTVLLSIEYRAGVDSVMASPKADIFSLTKESKEIHQLNEEFSNYLQSLSKEKKIDELQEKNSCFTPDEIKSIIEQFQSKYPYFKDKSEEEILSFLSEERMKAYNGLYGYLIGKEKLHSGEPNSINPQIYVATFASNFFNISENKKEEGGFFESDEAKKEREKRNLDSTNAENRKRLETLLQGSQVISVKPLDEFVSPLLVDLRLKSDEVANAIDRKSLDEYKKEGGCRNVKFVFLGDLIDLALESLNDTFPSDDRPRFVLSSMPLLLPTDLTDIKQHGAFSTITNTRKVNPNLADIPISLNLLQSFLVKTIIEAKKTRYPTIQFIKDLITQLINPAISVSVMGRSMSQNTSIKPSLIYHTFRNINGQDPVVELTPDGYPKTIDEERMKKLSDIQSGMIASSVKLGPVYDFHEDNKDTFTNYIFLNCSSKFPKQIDGNEESDFLKHGVLYVRMGTDMGLVKTINFSRVTAPYLREALATREGEGKGTTIKQYYKAKVKMFGNNIFRPGDYIYISPNYTFVDRRVDDRQESLVDLEDALGIGGYYLVLDVHTSVNDFSYETEMNCSFQAHRKHVGKNHYLVIHKDEECKKR